MKIVFKRMSGRTIELDGITSETTLRDVKRFYERATSLRRTNYRFIINGKQGHINDNSTMKFSEHLKLTYNLDFDESATLDIYVVLILGSDVNTQFRNKNSIPEDIKNSDNASRVTCGISLEVIEGIPVKINGRFYNVESFADYLVSEESKYQRSPNYLPVCPIRQALPEELENLIKYDAPGLSINQLRGRFLVYLRSISYNFIEDYEDELSKVRCNF